MAASGGGQSHQLSENVFKYVLNFSGPWQLEPVSAHTRNRKMHHGLPPSLPHVLHASSAHGLHMETVSCTSLMTYSARAPLNNPPFHGCVQRRPHRPEAQNTVHVLHASFSQGLHMKTVSCTSSVKYSARVPLNDPPFPRTHSFCE